MSTDGKLEWRPKGQKKATTVKVKGRLVQTAWTEYEQEYKQLALKYGLKVSSTAAEKTAVKKTAKKKAAKKK